MTDFFPPRPVATPTIYAFASTHPDDAGLLKVGYTERAAADRIAEQFPREFPHRIGVPVRGGFGTPSSYATKTRAPVDCPGAKPARPRLNISC